MFSKVKNYRSMVGATVLFILIGITVAVGHSINTTIAINNLKLSEVNQIIIDPGHGGIDPGAIGVDGSNEKDINLAISLCLKDILLANGYDVIMTRDEDISINDSQYKTIKKIKSSDLNNRLKIINDHPEAIAVSIHQNKYKDESSSGAQMFYGVKNKKSEQFANALQNSFNNNLQGNNNRVVKPSTSSVYIVHNANIPITLVECGFMSNYEDIKLLTNEEYQQKIAFTIFCGIVDAKKDSK